MDEVAATPIATVSFFAEGVAALGFIGSIMFHVNPKFVRTVGELALVAIGAITFFHEVFAEGALGFGGSSVVGEMEVGVG